MSNFFSVSVSVSVTRSDSVRVSVIGSGRKLMNITCIMISRGCTKVTSTPVSDACKN